MVKERESVLYFDGDGDYLQVKNGPNPTNAITVSCWAKSATPKWNSHSVLVSKLNAYSIAPRPQFGSKNLTFFISSGGNWYWTEFDLDIDITKWHHYTGTFDGKVIRLYVDGTEVSHTMFSGKINQTISKMLIGFNADNNNYFNGKMTEVCVWDKALVQPKLNKRCSTV